MRYPRGTCCQCGSIPCVDLLGVLCLQCVLDLERDQATLEPVPCPCDCPDCLRARGEPLPVIDLGERWTTTGEELN